MRMLKQSTACTIMFGQFLDVGDGITPLTDATTISDIDNASTGIFLSKAGGTGAIRHATVTASVADAYGFMKVALDATDTNTLGTLDVFFAKGARYLPVSAHFMIVPANVYDSLVGGSVYLKTDVTNWKGAAAPAMTGDAYAVVSNGTNGNAAINSNLLNGQGAIYVDTEAIKAQTDKLAFTVANKIDSNVYTWNGTAVAAPATAGYPAVTIKVGTGTGEINLSSGKTPSTGVAADLICTLGNVAHGGAAATMQLGGAGGLTATHTGNTTGSVNSITAGVTITTNNDKTGYSLSSPSSPKKNAVLANIPFLMYLSSDHVSGATGKTVTTTISKDGGAYGATSNSSAEISAGTYKISLTQAEMNADTIILRCTAAGCDDTFISMNTSA